MAEGQDDVQVQRMLLLMTTEHYNMQSARSATISESGGRSSLFLGSVSSTLVALGFVAQASKMGSAFMVFSLVLLPSLYFLGIVTFVRTLQSGIEDSLLSRGINRIRHYYAEVAPDLKQYLVLSTHDDNAGMAQNMGVRMSPLQLFVDTAGMISVIDSIIGGVFAAVVLDALGLHSIPVDSVAGVAVFAASLAILQRYQALLWQAAEAKLPIRFPSDPARS